MKLGYTSDSFGSIHMKHFKKMKNAKQGGFIREDMKNNKKKISNSKVTAERAQDPASDLPWPLREPCHSQYQATT